MANRPFDVKELINAWNTHSVDKVLEHYAENAELDTPEASQPLRGKSAIRENIQGWMKAFPDVTGDVEKSVVSGQEVALLVHFPIELGPGQTIPATNKKVEMPVAIFATLDQSGKIVKERDVFDIAGYVQQLGLKPEQMASQSAGRTSTPQRR